MVFGFWKNHENYEIEKEKGARYTTAVIVKGFHANNMDFFFLFVCLFVFCFRKKIVDFRL